MEEERPGPEVIRLPVAPKLPVAVTVLVCALMVAWLGLLISPVGIFGAWVKKLPGEAVASLLEPWTIFGVVGTLSLWGVLVDRASRYAMDQIGRFLSRRWLRTLAATLGDAKASAIVAAFEGGRRARRHGEEAWMRVADELGTPDSNRATMILAADIELPEWGRWQFEPFVIDRLQAFRRAVGAAGAIVLIIVIAFGIQSRILGQTVLIVLVPLFILGGLVAFGAFGCGYMRASPGLVEFLSYGPFSRRPRIRSYPIVAGTVIAVDRVQADVRLTFLRERRVDWIILERSKRELVRDHPILQAIMSSATAPRPSADELVG